MIHRMLSAAAAFILSTQLWAINHNHPETSSHGTSHTLALAEHDGALIKVTRTEVQNQRNMDKKTLQKDRKNARNTKEKYKDASISAASGHDQKNKNPQ